MNNFIKSVSLAHNIHIMMLADIRGLYNIINVYVCCEHSVDIMTCIRVTISTPFHQAKSGFPPSVVHFMKRKQLCVIFETRKYDYKSLNGHFTVLLHRTIILLLLLLYCWSATCIFKKKIAKAHTFLTILHDNRFNYQFI